MRKVIKIRKISEKELNEKLDMHKRWLDKNTPGGERADFSYLDLSGRDLHDSDLRYANFYRSNLFGVNMEGCNLQKVNFRYANLQKSYLPYVKLIDSGLNNANLKNSNLHGAIISKSVFEYANFSYSNLEDVVGEFACLDNSDITCSKLYSAKLTFCSFKRAKLGYSDLRKSDFHGSDFLHAGLGFCDLRYSDLTCCIFEGAWLEGCRTEGLTMPRGDLKVSRLPSGFYQVAGCGLSNQLITYDAINDKVIAYDYFDDLESSGGCNLDELSELVENKYGKNGKEPSEYCYVEYMSAVNFFKSVKKFRELDLQV